MTAPEKNAFTALDYLLKIVKVKVTATSLQNKLQYHSEFPRLTALSDVLTGFGVDNMATRLTPHHLADIPLPAIAHFDNGMGYVTITNLQNNEITWTHDQAGIHTESIATFSSKWRGVTLLVQPNETSGEQNYAYIRRMEWIENARIPLVIGGSIAIFLYALTGLWQRIPFSENTTFYGVLLAKTIGTVISILLLWYSFDANNAFLRKVCQLNSKTNCGSILSSNAASIWGIFTWSEIGLFYFAGGLLSLLTTTEAPALLSIFKLLNIIALPYTLWSIYYQAFVAKEWCVLCVSIQILLWTEFFLMLNTPFTFKTPPLGGGGLLLLLILWAFIKKPLANYQKNENLAITLQKLKFDPDYIKALLSKQRILPPIFEGMKVVELGNPLAENTIIFVSNPACGSCAIAHREIEKLIEEDENICCKILFATNMNNTDPAMQVANYILNLPTEKMGEATHSWYKNIKQDFKIWANKFDVQQNNIDNVEQLNLHFRWLHLANITEAPVIFFNNLELPKFYQISEFTKIANTLQKQEILN